MGASSLYVRIRKPLGMSAVARGQPRSSGSPWGTDKFRQWLQENAALGIRANHGPADGLRSVFDRELWRQGLVIGTMGAVSMALLACTVALARDTAGHDWYGAAKLTVADLMIGVGFDEDAPVEFRNADGGVETVTRSGLTDSYRVRWAREDILKSAWEGATLGAVSGFGGALLCFVLVWRSMDDRRGRRTASEPASERRSEARERLRSLQERPMSGPPPPPASFAPARAPADGSPVSSPPLPAKPEPTVTRQVKPKTSKDNKATPAHRERRKRDYGRWV